MQKKSNYNFLIAFVNVVFWLFYFLSALSLYFSGLISVPFEGFLSIVLIDLLSITFLVYYYVDKVKLLEKTYYKIFHAYLAVLFVNFGINFLLQNFIFGDFQSSFSTCLIKQSYSFILSFVFISFAFIMKTLLTYRDKLETITHAQNANCNYDIFYAISVNNRDHLELRRAVYNTGAKQIVDEELIISWPSSYTKGTITLSDFVGTSNQRRLYMAITSNEMTKSNDTLKIAYFKGPNWRHEETYVQASGSPAAVGEIELSADMSILAYTRPFAHAGNQGQLMLHALSPTGSFYGGTSFSHNIDPTFATHFAGLELTNDNHYAYVNGMGDGIYRVDISNLNNIQNAGNIANVDFSYSQIERAHNGKYYIVKPNGELKYFTNQFNGILPEVNLGSTAIINNAIHANDPYTPAVFNFYLIPDQIDGCEYNYTNGDEESCCEEVFDSRIKTIMPGVQENLNGDIIITGANVVWTPTNNPFTENNELLLDIYMRGNLIVYPSAKLEIDGLNLYFKEKKEVALIAANSLSGQGAKLYLKNKTKLTAYDICKEDVIWNGVRVIGNWQYAQTGSAQPLLNMNNATIEYALRGVDVPNGGKVNASLSHFKDNIYGVKFTSYSNNSTSSFSRCKFYTTSDLYNIKDTIPKYHVHIYSVPGLSFSGCTFENEYGNIVSASNRGAGILSSNSSLTIKEHCSSLPLYGYPCPNQNTTRSVFKNLHYGMKASNGTFFKLSRVDFDNCLRGAWLIDCDATTVTECNFNIASGSNSSVLSDSYGLYLESNTGYHIEGNEFQGGNNGLIVLNSGIDNNEIYRNDFYNINFNNNGVGALCIGANGWPMDALNGLQFFCNDFDQTNFGIAVTGGLIDISGQIIEIEWSGISLIQGYDLYSYLNRVPTRNTFWMHNQNNDNDFYIDENTSYVNYLNQNYFYYGSYDNLPNRNANIVSYDPNLITRNYIGTFTTREQECPQKIYSYGGIIIIQPLNYISGLNDEEIDLENELRNLLSYNESELVALAETANTFNLNQIYDILYAYSPNLSSKILEAFLNNSEVNSLSKVSLLLANSPLPSQTIDALNSSDIDGAYKNIIMQEQDGVNLIEEKLNRLDNIRAARQVSYDYLVQNVFKAESTSEFTNIFSTVLNFLETENNIDAKKRLINLYIYNSQFGDALSIINQIETIAQINEDFSLLDDMFIKKVNIRLLQSNTQEDIDQVISLNENYLSELASNYESKAGGAARAILETHGLWDNFPIIFYPNPILKTKSKQIFHAENDDNKEIIKNELSSLFNLYPNPAKDYLAIEFVNPKEETCLFNIYNISGKLVKTINSNQQLGYLNISTSDLPAGNYIIECSQLNIQQNFIISR